MIFLIVTTTLKNIWPVDTEVVVYNVTNFSNVNGLVHVYSPQFFKVTLSICKINQPIEKNIDALFLRSEGGSILGRFPGEFDSADNLLWGNSKLGPFLFRMVRLPCVRFLTRKNMYRWGQHRHYTFKK